jgi:hypothetical protein
VTEPDLRLDLLQRLCDLTERQLDAARRLDGKAMFDLLERRTDVLFSLRVAMQDPLPDDVELRATLADEARRLRHLERRLTHVAGLVLHTLERITPTPAPPPTYAATGRMTA